MARGGGEDGLPLGAIGELIPWLLTGALVLIGALTVVIYGLPFESKEAGQRNEAQIAEVTKLVGQLATTVYQLQSDEAVMHETIKNLSDREAEIIELRQRLENQAIHIQVLEAETQPDMAAREARNVRGHNKIKDGAAP